MQRRSENLDTKIQALCAEFSPYGPGRAFCTYCYSGDWIRTITLPPIRDLSGDFARKLLRKSGDHWHNANLYRHYLRRLLEALAPPELIEDTYPARLLETLAHQHFSSRPEYERREVGDFLEALSVEVKFADAEDEIEWKSGMADLVGIL